MKIVSKNAIRIEFFGESKHEKDKNLNSHLTYLISLNIYTKIGTHIEISTTLKRTLQLDIKTQYKKDLNVQ